MYDIDTKDLAAVLRGSSEDDAVKLLISALKAAYATGRSDQAMENVGIVDNAFKNAVRDRALENISDKAVENRIAETPETVQY